MSDPSNRSYGAYYRTSWAIIVGIDAYQHLRPLNSAVKDAHDVASMLMAYHSFPANQVILLTDDMATLDNILAIFDTVVNPHSVEPDDRILIYFAGHGITRTAQDGTKEGYLAPYDASPKLWRTLLPMTDLIRQAKFLPAKHILFVMDACYSGLSLRTTHSIPPVMDHFLTRRSVQVITAGREDEPVSDGDDGGVNSAFTGLFLDALAGSAVTASSLMTASDLMNFITRNITKEPAVAQSPQYGWVDGSGDFVFALPQGLYLPLRLEVTLRQGSVPARLLAINELTDIASSNDEDMAALAEKRLLEVAEYDPDPRVTHTALRLLGIEVPAASVPEPQPTSKAKSAARRRWRLRSPVRMVVAFALVTLTLAALAFGAVYLFLQNVPTNSTVLQAPPTATVGPTPATISTIAERPVLVSPQIVSTPLSDPTIVTTRDVPTPISPTTEQNATTHEPDPVFFDDFSNGDDLWESVPDDRRVSRVIQGSEMVFAVLVPNSLWFTRPRNVTVRDGTIIASVTIDPERQDGYFGILFRQVDADNYYYFRLSPSGEATLFVQLAGSVQELATVVLDPSSFNRVDSHEMGVHLEGTNIGIAVDGTIIAEVDDSRFQSGRVGLFVQTTSVAPARIHFTEFVLRED